MLYVCICGDIWFDWECWPVQKEHRPLICLLRYHDIRQDDDRVPTSRILHARQYIGDGSADFSCIGCLRDAAHVLHSLLHPASVLMPGLRPHLRVPAGDQVHNYIDDDTNGCLLRLCDLCPPWNVSASGWGAKIYRHPASWACYEGELISGVHRGRNPHRLRDEALSNQFGQRGCRRWWPSVWIEFFRCWA